MCGIAGIIDASAVSDTMLIDKMIASIAYRGPDGAGRVLFPEDGVALGHRRLSILDVTDAGGQPMSCADGRYWLTYNGEIYNYLVNVAFGGSLIAHVPEAVGESVPHRSPTRKPIAHRVVVDPDSRLAAALGAASVSVASWHHQAIDRLAPGFVPVARSDDGLVEAIERPDGGFLLAVQWHPELTAAHDPTQQRLFDALVKAAARA
jgi:hypothetical protein